MAKSEPVEVELVVWHDAVAGSGWLDHGHGADAAPVFTVGHVVKETDEYVVLAGSWGPDGEGGVQSNNRMTIPKGMLISRQTYLLPG